MKLGLDGAHQYENASLGVALAASYLQRFPRPTQSPDLWTKNFFEHSDDIFDVLKTQNSLQKPFLAGLSNCNWPGRSQKLQTEGYPKVTFYLDGAHTIESLKVCKDWFLSQKSQNALQILVWNCSDNRSPQTLLEQWADSPMFDHVIFSSSVAAENTVNPKLMRVPMNPNMKALEWQKTNQEMFEKLFKERHPAQKPPQTMVSGSIEQTLAIIKDLSKGPQQKSQVLITGSLYLVGGMLESLQPAMRDF